MPITLQISGGKRIQVDGDVVKIGRASGCAVSFPNEGRLDPEHAVLRRVADRWLIESRSGPVVQVGEAQPARMHWLKPGDIVKLTPDGPELTFEPQDGAAAPAAASTADIGEQTAQSSAEPVADSASHDTGEGHAPAENSMSPPEESAVETAASPPANRPLVAAARSVEETTAPPRRRSAGAAFGPAEHPALWAIGGAGLLLLGLFVCFFLLWLAGVLGTTPPVNQTASGDGQGIASGSEKHPDVQTKDTTGRSGTSTEITPATERDTSSPSTRNAGVNSTARAEPQNAVYTVVVTDRRRDNFYLVGNACAIGPDLLVTSASVVQAIRELRDRFPNVLLRRPDEPNDLITVNRDGLAMHPKYHELLSRHQVGRNRFEQKQEALNELLEPAQEQNSSENQQRIERLQQEMVDAKLAMFDAWNEQICYDIALLHVGDRLPHFLMIDNSKDSAIGDAPCILLGTPAKKGDIQISSDTSLDFRQIHGTAGAANSVPCGRVRVRCHNRIAMDRIWIGSPLLNADNEVVGVFSRLTPPADPNQQPSGKRFDAASVKRLDAL